MNGFRPTIEIEFDDKYIDARNKFFDCWKAFNALTDAQKHRLAQEIMTANGMATAFEQLVRYMNNGGKI